MDGTELVTLAGSVGGCMASFILGLRVCGPRLQTTWTERHPREIAEQIRDGGLKLTELTEHTRRLVVAELARMGNGLPVEASAQFLALDGIGGRYVGKSEPEWTRHLEVRS